MNKADMYYEDFCKEAKYCEENEGNKPYYVRVKGVFLCSAETDDLHEQYCKERRRQERSEYARRY